RASDAAGNIGPWPDQPQAALTVDLTPPQIAVITPTDGLLLPPGPLLLRGMVDPSVLVMINGQPAPVVNGIFTATLQLAVTDLPIRITATNAAGNGAERDLLVHSGDPVTDVPESAPNYAAV